jgi:hypothetical protein
MHSCAVVEIEHRDQITDLSGTVSPEIGRYSNNHRKEVNSMEIDIKELQLLPGAEVGLDDILFPKCTLSCTRTCDKTCAVTG